MNDISLINNNNGFHVLNKSHNVWPVVKSIATNDREDPFFVCNLSDIVQKHNNWKNLMTRVHPFYAVKCNDDLTVLKVLAAMGIGFDCASSTEISKILNIGVEPNRIIFANPTKPNRFIKYAKEIGVSRMTFDNSYELEKIKNLYPNAELVIRIKYDSDKAWAILGDKYGCDAKKDAPKLLQAARELNLNVIGVSFHVGTDCRDPFAYKNAICLARNVFDIAVHFGYDFKLLDIGGGFPGDHGTSIKEFAEVINSSLDLYFGDKPLLEIIAEPGRYYVSSAFTIACKIHSLRDDIKNDKPHKMYYIREGVFGSFNCVIYDNRPVYPQALHKLVHSNKRHYSSSIWGETNDNYDRVVEEVSLSEMEIGDWIVFENLGAYSVSLSTAYNGFPSTQIYYSVSEKDWSSLKDTLI